MDEAARTFTGLLPRTRPGCRRGRVHGMPSGLPPRTRLWAVPGTAAADEAVRHPRAVARGKATGRQCGHVGCPKTRCKRSS